MFKNGQTYFKNLAVFTTILLCFNIMKVRVNLINPHLVRTLNFLKNQYFLPPPPPPLPPLDMHTNVSIAYFFGGALLIDNPILDSTRPQAFELI